MVGHTAKLRHPKIDVTEKLQRKQAWPVSHANFSVMPVLGVTFYSCPCNGTRSRRSIFSGRDHSPGSEDRRTLSSSCRAWPSLQPSADGEGRAGAAPWGWARAPRRCRAADGPGPAASRGPPPPSGPSRLQAGTQLEPYRYGMMIGWRCNVRVHCKFQATRNLSRPLVLFVWTRFQRAKYGEDRQCMTCALNCEDIQCMTSALNCEDRQCMTCAFKGAVSSSARFLGWF